jgi:hypothetical protein
MPDTVIVYVQANLVQMKTTIIQNLGQIFIDRC